MILLSYGSVTKRYLHWHQ